MSSASGQWSDLGPRLISGGIAAAVGLWVMWLGGHPFHLLVAVISGIMVWEVAREPLHATSVGGQTVLAEQIFAQSEDVCSVEQRLCLGGDKVQGSRSA